LINGSSCQPSMDHTCFFATSLVGQSSATLRVCLFEFLWRDKSSEFWCFFSWWRRELVGQAHAMPEMMYSACNAIIVWWCTSACIHCVPYGLLPPAASFPLVRFGCFPCLAGAGCWRATPVSRISRTFWLVVAPPNRAGPAERPVLGDDEGGVAWGTLLPARPRDRLSVGRHVATAETDAGWRDVAGGALRSTAPRGAALAVRPSGLRARLVTGGRADAAHTEEEEDGRELGPTVPVLWSLNWTEAPVAYRGVCVVCCAWASCDMHASRSNDRAQGNEDVQSPLVLERVDFIRPVFLGRGSLVSSSVSYSHVWNQGLWSAVLLPELIS